MGVEDVNEADSGKIVFHNLKMNICNMILFNC